MGLPVLAVVVVVMVAVVVVVVAVVLVVSEGSCATVMIARDKGYNTMLASVEGERERWVKKGTSQEKETKSEHERDAKSVNRF